MRRFWLIFFSAIALALCLVSVRMIFAASVVIDPTVNITNTSHNGTTFTDAFVSSSTGYAFYRDANGTCSYAKTTDGGNTWGAAVTVDPNTRCGRVAIWFDPWTPGHSTGTIIHIITLSYGNFRQSALWYNNLNTANDTLATTTPVNISGAHTDNYNLGANLQAVTEGTDGTIYAGILGKGGSYVVACSANCAASSANWADAGTQPWESQDNNWLLLAPLPSAKILSVRFNLNTAPNRVDSSVYNAASSTWSATSAVDTNCPANTTYDGHFGTAVNLNTSDIYMAYACNIATISANTGEIRTQTYTVASSAWTRDTNVETSSTLGLTGVKLGIDINTGNIYVVYSGQTTPGTASTANVYYKISTSPTMSTWGTRQGPVNTTSTDIYGLRIDGMDNARLYATWVDGVASTLNGATIATFSANTYTQSGYRVFQNQTSTQVGTPFGAQNTASLIPLAGNPFRLRMLIAVAGNGNDVGTKAFKLQYATSTAGNCGTVPSANFADVGTATSSAISFYANAGVSNDSALTANAQDPTDGTNVIVNETYVSQNPFANDVAKILAGQDGKWDFSLINNSAPTGQTFCFRAVNSDGSVITYSQIPEVQVDSVPVITNLSLNGGQSITLIEGTTTLIVATATVTDANGFSDIIPSTGVAYRTSLGSSCTADPNNCYAQSGGTCSLSNCSGNSCTLECDYKIWYFAQPTDSGTPWAGDSWSTLMNVSDTVGSGATATSTGVSLLSLLAFETTSTINYGTFAQGQTMANLTATSVIRSSGNVAMNVNVYGTNMVNGAFSIAVGQQHFATSPVPYASGTTLLANPGSTVPIGLPKPSSTSATPSSTFYWGIAIPSGQQAVTYTGGNSFVGVKLSLPWP